MSGLVGVGLLGFFATLSVFPQSVTPYDPQTQDTANRLAPPITGSPGAPLHFMGTDQLGRDLLARVAHGGRVSMLVGFASVAIAGPFGLLLGSLAGYFGGRLETFVMGLVDIILAIPFVLMAIVVAALLGPGIRNVLAVLAVTGWVVFARVSHGVTLSVKTAEFVEAARALGADDSWILRRHVLAQLIGPFIVLATLQVGRMMLAEAALSFLGLGVEATRPSWGGMLGASRDYIWSAPWIVIFPGLAISITVLGANLLGDGLRLMIDRRAGGSYG